MAVDLHVTDADLIRESLAEASKFGAIFDRHFDAIYGYVARRAGPDVADTVASETFCAAFDQRNGYELNRSDARPWLFGIATNLLRQHWRSEQRRRAGHSRLHVVQGTRPEPTEPPDHLQATTIDDRLRDAVEQLQGGDRDVLLLLAWGQLSYQEIADALDIPLGTVQSRLHRARQAIRRQLAFHDTDDTDQPATPQELNDG